MTLAPELCQTLPQGHSHSPNPPDKGKGSSCMWGAHPPLTNRVGAGDSYWMSSRPVLCLLWERTVQLSLTIKYCCTVEPLLCFLDFEEAALTDVHTVTV